MGRRESQIDTGESSCGDLLCESVSHIVGIVVVVPACAEAALRTSKCEDGPPGRNAMDCRRRERLVLRNCASEYEFRELAPSGRDAPKRGCRGPLAWSFFELIATLSAGSFNVLSTGH